VRSRSLFHQLDVATPEIPERSELYSIEPVGVGTPFVESLTSYLSRLAEVHKITTGILLKEILGPRFNKKYFFRVNDQVKSPQGYRDFINSNGLIAKEFVSVIEQLTMRRDIQYLTLLPWGDFTGNRRLLREHRAWCPLCLEENSKWKGIIFEPLIWQVKLINKCPKHNVNLLETCLLCNKKNGVLTQLHRNGYCQKCNKPLWIKNSNTTDRQDGQWDNWVNDNISELLENHVNLVSMHSNNMPEIIRWLINNSQTGNIERFAEYFKLNISGVHKWLSGETIPRFDTMLKLTYFFNVSIFDLLFRDLDTIKVQKLNYEAISVFEVKSRRQINSSEIKNQLNMVLLQNEEPPPSLSEVSKRIQFPVSLLYRHARDISKQISERYIKYRNNKKEEKDLLLISEVLKITNEIYSTGIYPSYTEVQKRMSGHSRSYYRPKVKEAHLQVLQELRIQSKE
jgi:hypothetical protein